MVRRLKGIVSIVGAVLLAVTLVTADSAQAGEDRFIVVASTTSTEGSGLFDHLLPRFEEETGIEVRVVAVGTGQAIRLARNGDADALFVHHKPSELKFVEDGLGVKRYDVMYNDFVIVGPKSDPAGIEGMSDVTQALRKIEAAKASFASRGDDSGTHKRERSLWVMANVEPDGSWYNETGSGMGATLNTAIGMDAYAMSDRATWLAFGNRGDFEMMVEGDSRLFNQYGVIAVSKKAFPHVKQGLASQFVNWVTSPTGQKVIAEYRRDGMQLFFPNAAPNS